MSRFLTWVVGSVLMLGVVANAFATPKGVNQNTVRALIERVEHFNQQQRYDDLAQLLTTHFEATKQVVLFGEQSTKRFNRASYIAAAKLAAEEVKDITYERTNLEITVLDDAHARVIMEFRETARDASVDVVADSRVEAQVVLLKGSLQIDSFKQFTQLELSHVGSLNRGGASI